MIGAWCQPRRSTSRRPPVARPAPGPPGSTARVLPAAEQLDAAQCHLREAIGIAERMGLRPALVRGRLALAAGHAARRERSAAAAAARELAEEIAMWLLGRRAGRLAQE